MSLPTIRTAKTLAPKRARFERLPALLRANPALVPAFAGIVILVALGGSEAGFYPIGTARHPGLGWYPAALALLALLVAAVIAAPPPRPIPRAVRAGLTLLAGFTAWSYASIAWAEQQGVAWDGANRAALYLVVFALFALWPATSRGATVLIGSLGLGIAGLGLIELLKANASADPILYFIGARFAEPAGYINANVALWMIGMWPCLYLAAAREVNPALRGLALGGAGLLASLALLGQSRGWVVAVSIAALAFVVLAPARARALAALGAVAVATVLARGPLLAVHDQFTVEGFDGLLADATRAILVMAVVLALAGLAAGVADRRLTLGASRSRAANRAAVAVAVILLAAGGAAAIARTGNPASSVSDAWTSFKDGGEAEGTGSSRFSSVGTNRYDFWTVAWGLFREQPVRGIGSANFQQEYLVRGTSSEQPRYPHSLELGVLSQTGLVGAILLFGALLAGAAAAVASRRRGNREAAALVGTCATVFTYWLAHASIDWFWEFPALTASAFAALGLAGAVCRGDRGGAKSWRQRRWTPWTQGLWGGKATGSARVIGTGLAVAATAGLALALTVPWVAERETQSAIEDWPASPSAAFERLDRAQRLNPLSPRAHLVAAAIAIKVEDEVRARAQLEEVLRRDPSNSFALAELGALASERGERAEAERLLRRALARAPRDPVITEALDQVLSGRPIDVRTLNARYLRNARYRLDRR